MECALVRPVQIYFYTSLSLFTCLFIDWSDYWDYNGKQRKIPALNVASRGDSFFFALRDAEAFEPRGLGCR